MIKKKKKLILCSRYKLCFYSFSDDNLKSWDDFFFSMFAVFSRLGKDLQKGSKRPGPGNV